MKYCNLCGAELPRPTRIARNVYTRCPACSQTHRASFAPVNGGAEWSWSWKMTRARVLTSYVSFRAEPELKAKCDRLGDDWIRDTLMKAALEEMDALIAALQKDCQCGGDADSAFEAAPGVVQCGACGRILEAA